jgi:hypothetical protein
VREASADVGLQYFDTTFCGAEAGGEAWTTWTDCSTKAGYQTCEGYVANVPSAYNDAYCEFTDSHERGEY